MKVILLLLIIPFVVFSQGIAKLEKALEELRSVKVSFVQKVYYPWTSKPEISKGYFYASSSGKFRVEYEQPEKLLIVSDGREILIYSPKEKTAIRDSIDNNMSNVLFALFLVSKPISQVLESVGEVKKENITTLILKPKVKDELIRRVYIDIDENMDIKSIRTEDTQGTTIYFEIISVSKNFTPSQELFSTKIPKGVKVLNP